LKQKTHTLIFKPDLGEEINLKISTESENIIDFSFDFISKIMELLDATTYETEIKSKIGYVYPYYNKYQSGIISRKITVPEMLFEILALNIEQELKDAVSALLLRVL
jgi:hypothetical protein